MGAFLTANSRGDEADVKEKERSSPTARERDSTRDSVASRVRASSSEGHGVASCEAATFVVPARALLRLATLCEKHSSANRPGSLAYPWPPVFRATRSTDCASDANFPSLTRRPRRSFAVALASAPSTVVTPAPPVRRPRVMRADRPAGRLS